MAILAKVRKALRITKTDYDDELTDLIASALLDLGVAGVEPDEVNELVETAVVTYCKMNFGLPEDYDRLKKSYDEQKAQMSNASGYTVWEVGSNV